MTTAHRDGLRSLTLTARIARISALAGSVLTAAGTFVFAVAGIAHAQASDVVAALVFGLPACALFMFAARSVQTEQFVRGEIVAIAAGVLMIAVVILAGVSASYADPCFQVAHCTAAPTFAFIALNGATFVYVLAGITGLIISPVTIAIAGALSR